MGTYGLDGVMEAWKCEKLTAEQAVGQILQLLEAFDKRIADLERDLSDRRRGGSCGCQSGEADGGEGPQGHRCEGVD